MALTTKGQPGPRGDEAPPAWAQEPGREPAPEETVARRARALGDEQEAATQRLSRARIHRNEAIAAARRRIDDAMGSLVLLLSPMLSQSGELFKKCASLYQALGRLVARALRSGAAHAATCAHVAVSPARPLVAPVAVNGQVEQHHDNSRHPDDELGQYGHQVRIGWGHICSMPVGCRRKAVGSGTAILHTA